MTLHQFARLAIATIAVVAVFSLPLAFPAAAACLLAVATLASRS